MQDGKLHLLNEYLEEKTYSTFYAYEKMGLYLIKVRYIMRKGMCIEKTYVAQV